MVEVQTWWVRTQPQTPARADSAICSNRRLRPVTRHAELYPVGISVYEALPEDNQGPRANSAVLYLDGTTQDKCLPPPCFQAVKPDQRCAACSLPNPRGGLRSSTHTTIRGRWWDAFAASRSQSVYLKMMSGVDDVWLTHLP